MAETRKLAAILAADVVGYSRLAGTDEDRTLARLRALRSDLIDPTIAVHHGRVVWYGFIRCRWVFPPRRSLRGGRKKNSRCKRGVRLGPLAAGIIALIAIACGAWYFSVLTALSPSQQKQQHRLRIFLSWCCLSPTSRAI